MPTPFGHSLAGITIAGAGRKRGRTPAWLYYAGAAFLGCLSDADLVLGIVFGDGRDYHHGPFHSLAFAVAVASIVALFAARIGDPAGRFFLVAFLCVVSNPILDMLRARGGVQLLWPFSREYFSLPWHLFGHSPSPDELLTPYGIRQLTRALLVEVTLIGSAFVLILGWKRLRRPGRRRRTAS